MATTYNDLYLDTRRALKQAGIEAAQLEARELVCCASGKTQSQFYRDLQLYPSDPVLEKTQELIRRRLAGEPVAYIIGEWEFYGLPLDVTKDVLIPRMDTEILAEQSILLARAVGAGARVIDLCAGSGCVGLAVAANVPGAEVALADVSEAALEVCQRNIVRCKLEDRVACVRLDAREQPRYPLENFDVIASNPPYIPSRDIRGLDSSVRDYEPRLALDGGSDGLDFYRAIARQWKGALRPGGSLLFEVGQGQDVPVGQIMVREGYENVRRYQDTAGIWRVVAGTAV